MRPGAVAAAVAALATTAAANIYCPSLTYVGVSSGFDAWCQAACNQWTGTLPGFCPASFCKCADGEAPTNDGPFCESPRTACTDDKYIANPGTTASDQWCQDSCSVATNEQECPCTMCLCKDGNNGGGGGGDDCPDGVLTRREWHDLSDDEKQSYVEAVRVLYDNGVLGDFCQRHASIAGQGHGAPYFFPFHRCLIDEWEAELQNAGWTGGMPYWDATLYFQDISTDPIWDYFGNADGNCVNTGVFNGITDNNGNCIRRSMFNPTVFPPEWVQQTRDANPDFEAYRVENEFTQHARVHIAVGGQMGSVPTSACDPVFYLHHAAIDYYWWDWQQVYDPEQDDYAPGLLTTDEAPLFEPTTISECLTNIGLCATYEPPGTEPAFGFLPGPQPAPSPPPPGEDEDAPADPPPDQGEDRRPIPDARFPPPITREEAEALGLPFEEAQAAEERVEERLGGPTPSASSA